ncbi:MAG: hypothetical protein KF858_06810 [Candidatus Sumerlaeia bacterium]|nr:hypothetical protein [Candidatus Sumerlaeia bacterium]
MPRIFSGRPCVLDAARLVRLLLGFLLFAAATPSRGDAFDPRTLPEVGYHPSGISYWDVPFFADAMRNAGGWIEFAPNQWGNYIPTWNQPQFDANGAPRFLNPDRRLRALTFGLHVDTDNRPATWPRRNGPCIGRVVVEWKGAADIRTNAGGTFLADDSNGPGTGRLEDGRRVFRFSGGAWLQFIEIHDIDPDNPPTDIRVWLPDPADPMNRSLEGQLFHPTFLARLADEDWGFIRFMNMTETNGNPEQDWSDRRPPSHLFFSGTMNPRAPATGASGNRPTGMPWEHIVALCNASGKDLWLTVPHLATEDYVRRLARLIRFGSDGVNPYEGPVESPVHPPLAPGRRVYVEYSNEIWANGHSFPQGDWAQQQASGLGLSKAQFNARRFCEIWRLFTEEFGGADRLVRVAAVFTAADWYTGPFLLEIAAWGPTLSPAVEPDVIAVTTYFGNGIQDYAWDRAREQAGTDDPWFLTPEEFNAGGGSMRPVAVSAADAYWTGDAVERHLDECFDEWTRRLLAGDAREGAGPDAVGVGGGFDVWLRKLAQTAFPTPKPIVAYEGGPSLYTDNRDGGDPRDDGLTTFMELLNRQSRFREVYGIHLNMAKAKGLWTHVMFTDSGRWGKWGQWGHLEHLDQDPASAVKYQFLLDWFAEARQLRHVDDPAGAVPHFATAHVLPVAAFGEPYEARIETAGGDGERTLAVVGARLLEGLELVIDPTDASSAWVRGTPGAAGMNYVALRVVDAGGDPAWRTFSVRTVGGPTTLLEANLSGTNPALNLPWTTTHVRREGLAYSGLRAGTGIVPRVGDNALVWAQNMPADEAASTLALAIADGEWIGFEVAAPEGSRLDLAGHEWHVTLRRRSWHAPRRYAFFTSIGGFVAGAQLLESDRDQSEDEAEFRIVLPDEQAFRQIEGPVEFRIYGHAGQYGGHDTSLLAVRLDGEIVPPRSNQAGAWRVF